MSTASHSLRILLSGGQGRFVSTSRYVRISPWIERTGCRFEQWTQGEIRMEATTEREREKSITDEVLETKEGISNILRKELIIVHIR